MDLSLLIAYARVILRELWQFKFLAIAGFAFFSFAVLLLGLVWPVKFQSSATVFADNQNILKPLLDKQAAVSRLQDQTKVVRDVIHSPRILKDVVEQVYGADGEFALPEDIERKINSIRSRLKISGLGSNYIKITYTDSTSDDTYNIINSVIDLFIQDSSEGQRSESREAFQFIDAQVKQYKTQLVEAENRLKEFQSLNFDGRGADVDSNISRLRNSIEDLKISIDEDKTKIASLEGQLSNESRYSAKQYKADVYRQRLAELEERLSTLLLIYKENYPDVVSLKLQIDDMHKTIREAELSTTEQSDSDGDVDLNPLYQELRSKLAEAKVSLTTKVRRLKALEKLREEEFDRRKRIAARNAEESELTRDYNVTKGIYEDMLERREKARLSMTLNIEGQGVSYRIQEPAVYPLNPTGLSFYHFVILGPIVGLMAVLGSAVAYVVVDTRIRFSDSLMAFEGVKTLTVVPHITTPITQRVMKVDMLLSLFFVLLTFAGYVAFAYMKKTGVL